MQPQSSQMAQPMPSAQPAAPQSPAPQPQAGAANEAQQLYDTVVGQTEEYIYGQGLANIKERLQAGADDGIEDDVGAVVGQLLTGNYEGAMEAGKTIPVNVMVGACKELTEVVTDIAVEMQLINPQQADAAADEAFYAAMGTFGKLAAPHMPEEEKQQYGQVMQQIIAKEEQAKGGQAGTQPSQPVSPNPTAAAPMQSAQPVGAML